MLLVGYTCPSHITTVQSVVEEAGRRRKSHSVVDAFPGAGFKKSRRSSHLDVTAAGCEGVWVDSVGSALPCCCGGLCCFGGLQQRVGVVVYSSVLLWWSMLLWSWWSVLLWWSIFFSYFYFTRK